MFVVCLFILSISVLRSFVIVGVGFWVGVCYGWFEIRFYGVSGCDSVGCWFCWGVLGVLG